MHLPKRIFRQGRRQSPWCRCRCGRRWYSPAAGSRTTDRMELDPLLRALEATSIATAVRENESLFPWVESFHVLAIVLVIGSIAIVDLRLMRVASRERSIGQLAADVLPCTWVAFAVAAVSGALLFSSNA